VTAPANELSITSYVQCWLFPDSTDAQPIVLYVLDWPKPLANGVDLEVQAKATGIVYKRWSYLGAQQMEVAPVVLAKTVALLASPAVPSTTPRGRTVTLFAVLATLVASLLTVALLFRYSAHRYQASDRAAALPETIPELSAVRAASILNSSKQQGELHRTPREGADDERLS
jgi:hypothetical protein